MVHMDGLRYSPDDPYYRLGPVHTCLYVRACRLVTRTSSYVTPVSLGYPLSVFIKNSTLKE